jgi:hypothetical protein
MFGFKIDGGSVAAGVVATALAFGLTLLALVAAEAQQAGETQHAAVRAHGCPLASWEEVLSSALAAGEGCHMFHGYGMN